MSPWFSLLPLLVLLLGCEPGSPRACAAAADEDVVLYCPGALNPEPPADDEECVEAYCEAFCAGGCESSTASYDACFCLEDAPPPESQSAE